MFSRTERAKRVNVVQQADKDDNHYCRKNRCLNILKVIFDMFINQLRFFDKIWQKQR